MSGYTKEGALCNGFDIKRQCQSYGKARKTAAGLSFRLPEERPGSMGGRPAVGFYVPKWRCCTNTEAFMTMISTIGLDIAKHVFQVHGADASGSVVIRQKLRRKEVLTFFASLPPCIVGLEACGGAHYWAREIERLGHTIRLIAPAYVKPFV